MSKKLRRKFIRHDALYKDGIKHYIRIQKTGNKMPQPARIIITHMFWDDTGGWRGWETYTDYDRIFDDWNYAHAVYDEILKRWGNQNE